LNTAADEEVCPVVPPAPQAEKVIADEKQAEFTERMPSNMIYVQSKGYNKIKPNIYKEWVEFLAKQLSALSI